MKWEENINEFIRLASKHNVRMLMVGGGAVNYHGYNRHSADVDFWIDTSKENLENLAKVFREMEYDIEQFPNKVVNKEQNISVKFSPDALNLELITNFPLSKSFDEAYEQSEQVEVNATQYLKWNVLNLNDLIESKLKSGRPKDLLDIQELKKTKK